MDLWALHAQHYPYHHRGIWRDNQQQKNTRIIADDKNEIKTKGEIHPKKPPTQFRVSNMSRRVDKLV